MRAITGYSSTAVDARGFRANTLIARGRDKRSNRFEDSVAAERADTRGHHRAGVLQ
jgi:hypothetical protein